MSKLAGSLWLKLAAGLWLLSLVVCASAEARHLHVYSPETADKGEVEISYWIDYFAETDQPLSGMSLQRNRLFRHSIEFEYGVTDDWTLSLYGDWEDADGSALEYVQTRVESKNRLLKQDEQLVDASLYLEYAVPRPNYEEHDELEAKLLLQRAAGPLVVRLNPVFEQEIRGDEGFELGYEAGVYTKITQAVMVGVEGLGAFGPLDNFDPTRDQTHSIGPVVTFQWGELAAELGVQFGVAHGADDVVIKTKVSYAFGDED